MNRSEDPPQVRWGIVGAANIARTQFLPALREAGGHAVLVAGRDGPRAAAWAAEHGVDRGVAGYEAAIEAPDVDALYIPLPNGLHAEWARRALEAGKVVLCEKPLCVGAGQTESVLDVARSSGALLWEAFVFPFQPQHARLVQLLSDGAVGEVREIVGAFHFPLTRPGDIRLSGDLGGGVLGDLGCYPIRFAQEILGAGSQDFSVVGTGTGNGEVETDAAGIVRWDAGRLVLGCGFHRASDTFTRILGTTGQLQISNAYHPTPGDSITLCRPGQPPVVEPSPTDGRSFTAALRHIHRVVAGEEAPRHLAIDDSLATARVIDALTKVCRPAPTPA